jgi:hypothetical protein
MLLHCCCRRMLHLNELVDEETDIDRITGAATWSMPSSPNSQHAAAADAGAAAAAVSSSQRSRMAEGGAVTGSGGGNVMRRSSSMGTALAGSGAGGPLKRFSCFGNLAARGGMQVLVFVTPRGGYYGGRRSRCDRYATVQAAIRVL